MPKNYRLPLASPVALLAIAVSTHSFAQNLPNTVDRLAREMVTTCARSDGQTEAPADRLPNGLVQLVTTFRGAKVYVVDWTQTSCSDSGPVCGTGGCPLGVFRDSQGVVTVLYDAQAHAWKPSRNRGAIEVAIHGSHCGGVGADPCVVVIDLKSGKRQYQKRRF